jgi:hypothetical protein
MYLFAEVAARAMVVCALLTASTIAPAPNSTHPAIKNQGTCDFLSNSRGGEERPDAEHPEKDAGNCKESGHGYSVVFIVNPPAMVGAQ